LQGAPEHGKQLARKGRLDAVDLVSLVIRLGSDRKRPRPGKNEPSNLVRAGGKHRNHPQARSFKRSVLVGKPIQMKVAERTRRIPIEGQQRLLSLTKDDRLAVNILQPNAPACAEP